MFDEDAGLRALVSVLDPKARDDFRRVLIRGQPDRDAIASRVMRYRDQIGQDWADIIDFLTMVSRCSTESRPHPRRVGSEVVGDPFGHVGR